ncbi:hypothetical protein L0337_35145 [candidate division KSB1 bacterium]|nr:hypothetical protein [candidate division KSB1 bacterium]
MIEKTVQEEFVVFALSGRIEAALTVELQKLLDHEAESRNIVLDLRQVQLVDQNTVKFLARCEAEGIKLQNCPAYIIFCKNERAIHFARDSESKTIPTPNKVAPPPASVHPEIFSPSSK